MSLFTSTRPAGIEALPRNAASHFKLATHSAVLHLVAQFPKEQILREFSFLQSYLEEAA